VNAKTASDLRSYGAAVVSDERESRTGHVVNCTTQVELHQIYFNIKPESPGTTCSLLPLLLITEVLTRVSVVLQQWIFWSMGDTSSRRCPPRRYESFLLSLKIASIWNLLTLLQNIIY
jgi:hypothetical protein